MPTALAMHTRAQRLLGILDSHSTVDINAYLADLYNFAHFEGMLRLQEEGEVGADKLTSPATLSSLLQPRRGWGGGEIEARVQIRKLA